MATSTPNGRATPKQTLALLLLAGGLAFALFVEPGVLRDRPVAPDGPTTDTASTPTSDADLPVLVEDVFDDRSGVHMDALPEPVRIGISWNRDTGGVPAEVSTEGDPYFRSLGERTPPPPPLAGIVIRAEGHSGIALWDTLEGRWIDGARWFNHGDRVPVRGKHYLLIEYATPRSELRSDGFITRTFTARYFLRDTETEQDHPIWD